MTKLHRLLKLIGLLQASQGYRIDGLAEACGVSRRTIFRDLDMLREAGLPLVLDLFDQRYRLPGATFLPPTQLTADEALSLIVLGHEAGSKLPMLEPARSAAVKLEASLPLSLRQRLRHVSDGLSLWPHQTKQPNGKETIYQDLLAAIASRQAVRIFYHSRSKQKELAPKLFPYKLLFSGRDWYVIGRSQLHDCVRMFNLSRIRMTEALRHKFTIPRSFSLECYLRNAWHLNPEKGRPRKVVVRFSPAVADQVAEVLWHHSQTLQRNSDGSLEFSASVCGLQEISSWILGYGDNAQVIFPIELRHLIARTARKTFEQYEQFQGR